MTAIAPAEPPPLTLPGPALTPIQRLGRRWAYVGFVTVELVAFLALWQVAIDGWHVVNPVFLPSPWQVGTAIWGMAADGTLWVQLFASLEHWGFGFVIASLAGICIGLVMGAVEPVGRLVSPLAWALYSSPFVVFQPMLIIWFGFGDLPIVALVVFSAIFPILLTTAAGVHTVDASVQRAAKVFGASWFQRQVKITLPATIPFFVVGMRLAIPVSLIGMLIGEFLGAPDGLGRIIAVSSKTFRVDQAIGAVVVLVACSALMLNGFHALERFVAPWRSAT